MLSRVSLLPVAQIVTPLESPREPQPARLSNRLRQLGDVTTENGLTFYEVLSHLSGRVYPLLLVFIALPFCQPIALPGLSTPFGLVIVLLGLRFAFRKKPWLPKRLMERRIPAKPLRKILFGGAAFLTWIEKFLHPRAGWMFAWKPLRFITGCGIAACGILLLLPLPVPMSNWFPAVAIVLTALAISERDGLILMVGGVFFVLSCLYVGLIFLGGAELLDWMHR